jgi:hypothetical protein
MKARGMEAVVSKTGRRKLGFKRKEAPGIAIVVGSAPPKPEVEDEAEEGMELECPKCGAMLADTPENRAYLDSKKMTDADEEMDEAEDMDADEEDY